MRKTNSDLLSTGAALVDSDMYTADQTAGAGATISTSNVVKTGGADVVTLKCKATGANASSAGIVTFTIVGSFDGSTFETVGTPIALTLSTNTVVSVMAQIETRGFPYIEVKSIVNGDASYGLTAVNVHAYAMQ